MSGDGTQTVAVARPYFTIIDHYSSGKMVAQVTLAKGPPVEARKVYRAAKQCKPENAIRFWGCYTDGGCDLNRRQYWVCAFW